MRNGIKGIRGVKVLWDNKLLHGFGIFIEKLFMDFLELPWMNEWEFFEVKLLTRDGAAGGWGAFVG